MDTESDEAGILETLERDVNTLALEKDNHGDEIYDDDVEKTTVLEELPEEQQPKSVGNEASPFDNLPAEVILSIFSFLTLKELCKHVALVCKLWLCYSRCPLLWQRLSLSKTSRITSLEELSEFIQSHCPLLKHLCLKPRTELTLHGCKILAQSTPHLQSLSLSTCGQITKETLNQFVTNCPALCDINLEGSDVTDRCLEGLEKLPLKKLNAFYCSHLTDFGLVFLSTQCRQLCSLNFDGVQWITHDAIAVLVENCQGRLKHLWLDGEDMTDVTVQIIAKCRHLKSFGLSFCDSLTDQSLVYIQNLSNLVTLKLNKGKEFSAKALKELFEHLHPHRTGSPTGLLHVNVADCTNLNDAAVQSLADRYLESIDISWCWEVTDAGLDHVINKCCRIVDMNICGVGQVLGNPLKEIPQRMLGLRRLSVTMCDQIPAELLEEIAFIMPHMTIIDYYEKKFQPSEIKA